MIKINVSEVLELYDGSYAQLKVTIPWKFSFQRVVRNIHTHWNSLLAVDNRNLLTFSI